MFEYVTWDGGRVVLHVVRGKVPPQSCDQSNALRLLKERISSFQLFEINEQLVVFYAHVLKFNKYTQAGQSLSLDRNSE